MKKQKRYLAAMLLCLVIIMSVPVSVSANAPMASRLRVSLLHLPSEAVYADLLIKIDQNDSKYVDFQANAYVESAAQAKEIVEYAQDGFRSFSFHYDHAKSDFKIRHYYREAYVEFGSSAFNQEYLTQFEDLCKNYADIKIALLDKDFRIITVSETAKLPHSIAIRFNGNIDYDFAANGIVVDTMLNPYAVLMGILFSALILVSVGAETLMALLFRFRGKQLLRIMLVNLCSQIVMRGLYVALPFSYLTETILLEVLVYGTEFLIYRKYFKDISAGRLVGYTITANTVSLLLGLLLYI